MNELNSASESGESRVESTFPESEVVPLAKSPVSRSNPVNTIERIARSAETITAIERSLAVSQQLPEIIRAINRPLAVSDCLSESIRAACRPLAVSDCLSESMRAACRPLAVSDCLSESMRSACRPLAVSDCLSESMRSACRPPAVSDCLSESMRSACRPLAVSDCLSESMRAITRPLTTPWSKGFIVSRYPRTIPTLIPAPRLATDVENPETRTNSFLIESEEHSLVAENTYWLTQFDALVRDEGLRRFCRSLFADGYYDLAVQRACTYLHNIVREKSARYDKDGADLMMAVFSPKNPTLLLNQLTTPSERNEQQGYMFLLAGTMTGIRNPRSHEHDLEDSPDEALEILVLVNHLMRRLNNSALA